MSREPSMRLAMRFSFSSEEMPADFAPAKRALLWLDAISNSSIKLDIDCPDRDDFYGVCDTVILGSSLLTRAQANSVRLRRRNRHIALDNNDSLLLLVHDGGGRVGGTQFGRDVVLSKGSVALFDSKDEQLTQARDGGAVLGLYVPRDALAKFGINIEDRTARLLDGNNEAMRLLVGYLKVLMAAPTVSAPALASITDTHIGDLLALALDAKADVAHLAKSRGLHAMRVSTLRQAIASNAARQDLNAETLSKMLGLSPRYIQHLLNVEGTTLTERLTARRLDLACRALRDPLEKMRSIAEIAYRSGFSDLSTFYRAFRKQFGTSPGEFRGR